MWNLIIMIILYAKPIFGLNTNEIELRINYLNYREVRRVCLLTCNHNYSAFRFTKNASLQTIAVSKVNIDRIVDRSEDYDLVQLCLKQNFVPVGVILDAQCQRAEDVLHFASRNKYMDSKHYWIIIDNKNWTSTNNSHYFNKSNNSNTTVIDILGNLNISVDADIILVTQNENFTYALFDVFNYGKIQGGDLIMEEVGAWALKSRLQMFVDLNGYKYYRRWDFHDWSMRMVLVVSPRTMDFELIELQELKAVSGVATITHTSMAALLVIAEIHNFRYSPTITDRWISTFDRNSTKSVSNMIYFEEQDISPVIRYLYNIYENIDVLHTPVTSIETRYYYRIPSFGPGKFENQFLRPFSNSAWWCVVAVSVLCAILLLLSACPEDRPSAAQYAVFSVVASICQQFFQDIDDSGTRKESTARRLTIFVTGLSCFLIYNYYTSSVVSWLLNGPPPSINSLRELLESPLELIYQDIGYTTSWLQTPTFYYNKANAKVEDEIRKRKVFNKKKDAPLLVPLDEGISMVKNGGFAYHTERSIANDLIAKSFTQTELCELGSLQSMAEADLYPCVQKKSPYKEFLTWSLMRLSERGIVSRIRRRTSSPEISCEGSSPRPLALGGAAPAFILLAVGYMMAAFIMIIESARNDTSLNLELYKDVRWQ